MGRVRGNVREGKCLGAMSDTQIIRIVLCCIVYDSCIQ